MNEVKLVISNIPDSLNEKNIRDILDKVIAKQYSGLNFIKPSHKYNQKNNCICTFTVNSYEARLELIKFLQTYELITTKGSKQKLKVDTCILQQLKVDEVFDEVENSYMNLEYFKDFKKCFEEGNLLDFKEKENNSKCKNLILLRC